jgi:uridine kinase
MHQYENHVKPAYDRYIAPTMQHADIIVPRYAWEWGGVWGGASVPTRTMLKVDGNEKIRWVGNLAVAVIGH